jgi:hypothetical protein
MVITIVQEVISFGGTLVGLDGYLPPSPTWTLVFGGLDVTHLAYDITMKKARV